MNKEQSTTSIRESIISSQRDYSMFTLEITTEAERKDISLNLSGAEVLLDALSNHRCRLTQGLETLRDSWATDEKVTLEQIQESFRSGDFVRLMENIKVCDYYIDLIAAHTAAALR